MKVVQTGKHPPDEKSELRTERAAIYEYDAGISPEEAENKSIRDHPCRCGSKKYWISIHGPIICGMCHPPAAGMLVKRWVEIDSYETKPLF